MTEERTYSIEELSTMTGVSPRTIRLYIQMELVDRPQGERRWAKYLDRHLEQLLRIKRLSAEGLSLERIRQKMDKDEGSASEGEPVYGSVDVFSHIHVGRGIDIVVNPAASELSAQQMRQFITAVLVAMKEVKSSGS